EDKRIEEIARVAPSGDTVEELVADEDRAPVRVIGITEILDESPVRNAVGAGWIVGVVIHGNESAERPEALAALGGVEGLLPCIFQVDRYFTASVGEILSAERADIIATCVAIFADTALAAN